MCLAIPVKLTKVQGDLGRIEEGGITREVNLALLPEAKPGDHVLVHAGFAIRLIDEAEAAEILDLLEQMARSMEEEKR